MSRRTFPTPIDVGGVPLLVESSSRLPMVDVVFVFRVGALDDPPELAGLTRFVARSCRAGTATHSTTELEERIAALGARLAVDVGTGHVRFHGVVVSRNLVPFVALLAELMLRPAFRGDDLERIRRECLADLEASLDDDRFLASRAFRAVLFGDHAFGRSLAGTPKTLRSFRRKHVIASHARMLFRDRLLVGFAGDVTPAHAESLTESVVAGLPARGPRGHLPPPTSAPRGLSVVVVDKPDRTQCQLVAGTLGIARNDPHLFPLHVANTAFGGTFSGRLMNEIRVKRGYSYGAGSRVAADVRRDAFTMSSFPTAEHAVDCAELMLGLQRTWVREGLTARELRAAKSYLVNGRCFEDDTPGKRLEARLDVLLHDASVAHYVDHDRLVRAVTLEDAHEALRSRISTRDRVLAVVGNARTLEPALRKRLPTARVGVLSLRDVSRGNIVRP